MEIYRRQAAPAAMSIAAEPFEERYGRTFEWLAHFSHEMLANLHRSDSRSLGTLSGIWVASESNTLIQGDICVLTRIANRARVTVAERRDYLAALLRIYDHLLTLPTDALSDSSTLCVGIEREGRILAEKMACLPEGRSLRPNAKRIPFEGGLLVGVGDVSVPNRGYRLCNIVDGAIASGATLIAVIQCLRQAADSFRVFSAHATAEGLRALQRYSDETELKLDVFVGHASSGMNAKYYAIGMDGRLVVGDLGDTLAPIDHSHC